MSPADLHAAGLPPEVADALLAVRDELRADVLDVFAGHIREQEASALDQGLRRRLGAANLDPEKP